MKDTQVRGDVDPTQVRDISLSLLDAHRREIAHHDTRGERLAFAGGEIVRTARRYGMPWTDIAHTLGVSIWTARLMARRCS